MELDSSDLTMNYCVTQIRTRYAEYTCRQRRVLWVFRNILDGFTNGVNKR